MRVAFVTTEYVSEYRKGGGLGNYLARMCRVLLEHGHTPEVFVTSDRNETTVNDGVVVHYVSSARWRARLDRVRHVARFLPRGGWAADCSAPLLAGAVALAGALRRRERDVRFDCVQSADYQAAGLLVARRRRRPHVVRCSTSADLWGRDPWQCYWEKAAIKRADRAYAPSRFIADHLSTTHGLEIGVVRPPFFAEAPPSQGMMPSLPARYLIHFGQISTLKGSDFLAEALPVVWGEDPSVRMVWAGRCSQERMESWQSGWGHRAQNVTYLGAIEKTDLYQALSGAEASVLPSRIDNLPNTAIESLMYDKPVIGTRGSSIDEIVTDGVNGLLVDYGDTHALAAAILRVWQNRFPRRNHLAALSPIWQEMQPEAAIDSFFKFALEGRKPQRT